MTVPFTAHLEFGDGITWDELVVRWNKSKSVADRESILHIGMDARTPIPSVTAARDAFYHDIAEGHYPGSSDKDWQRLRSKAFEMLTKHIFSQCASSVFRAELRPLSAVTRVLDFFRPKVALKQASGVQNLAQHMETAHPTHHTARKFLIDLCTELWTVPLIKSNWGGYNVSELLTLRPRAIGALNAFGGQTLMGVLLPSADYMEPVDHLRAWKLFDGSTMSTLEQIAVMHAVPVERAAIEGSAAAQIILIVRGVQQKVAETELLALQPSLPIGAHAN